MPPNLTPDEQDAVRDILRASGPRRHIAIRVFKSMLDDIPEASLENLKLRAQRMTEVNRVVLALCVYGHDPEASPSTSSPTLYRMKAVK